MKVIPFFIIFVKNITDMKRVVLLGLLIMSMVSCSKEEKVLMKYAYITQDNIDYKNENGYGVITTHLCPVDVSISPSDIERERNNQKFLTETNSKKILADTLVSLDSDVTKSLFRKINK
jgi:hypothetical protein